MPIRGIGIDIEEIRKFRDVNALKKNMLRRIFTKKELAYCFSKRNTAQHLTARFAAKEAFYKALSPAKRTDIGFKSIEIIPALTGAPRIHILDKRWKHLKCSVSLSHTKEMAVAVVLLEEPF